MVRDFDDDATTISYEHNGLFWNEPNDDQRSQASTVRAINDSVWEPPNPLVEFDFSQTLNLQTHVDETEIEETNIQLRD